MAVSIGKPWPLGSSLVGGGVNFSVAAPEATKVELLLFASGSANEPKRSDAREGKQMTMPHASFAYSGIHWR